MIRTLAALSILAAAAVAAPASAESLTVSLTGKSTAERFAAIHAAAQKVCVFPNDPFRQVDGECVFDTVHNTLAKIGDPALLQYARSVNYTKLASN